MLAHLLHIHTKQCWNYYHHRNDCSRSLCSHRGIGPRKKRCHLTTRNKLERKQQWQHVYEKLVPMNCMAFTQPVHLLLYSRHVCRKSMKQRSQCSRDIISQQQYRFEYMLILIIQMSGGQENERSGNDPELTSNNQQQQ